MYTTIYFALWSLAYAFLGAAVPTAKDLSPSPGTLVLPRITLPSSSSEPFFTAFEIITIDYNSKDISTSVTPRYHQLDLSPSKSRRQVSRLANNCPRGWQFWWSSCSEFEPRGTRSICSNGRDDQTFDGNCMGNEICVDYYAHTGDIFPEHAYCVSHERFVNIATSELQNLASADSSSLHLPPTNDGTYSLAAVLVTTNGGLLVKASSITIEERKTELVHGVRLMQTLPSGIEKCRGCSRIGVPLVLQGTQKFLFNVVLPFNVANAVLLVTSFIR